MADEETRDRRTATDGRGAAAERPARRVPARGWAMAAVAAFVLLLVYVVRYELLPFVIAAGVGFVMDPAIRRLQPYMGRRRWVAATVLFVLLLLATVALGYWIGKVVLADLMALARDGPRMVHELLRQTVGDRGVSLFGHTYTADSLTRTLQDDVGSLVGASGYAEVMGIGIGTVLGLFLTLVLIPYFLISGPRLVEGAIWLLPPERRVAVRRILPSVVPVLRRYLVGVAVVVSFTACAAYVGFGLLFRLPHAVLLSVAVGTLEIIPALGPLTSMILVGLSALQQHSLAAAALLMAYAVFLRLAIDNAVGPLVLGQSARLHPVAVMFAFVCGAALLGVMGLLLAVPAAACLMIVLDHYYARPVTGPDQSP